MNYIYDITLNFNKNNLYEFYSRPTDIRAAILSIIHAFHFCHPA